MSSRRFKNRLYRFLYKLGQSPIEVLEAVQFLLLGWVLIDTLIGFGGFLDYAEPMVGVSGKVFILAGIHALVVVFREARRGIDWELLLPLPFLAYAWLHYQFFSPTPWMAGLYLTVFVQAYVCYFVVVNSIHGSRHGMWVLSICQGVLVIALLTAFFQFYQFPEWMVTLDRERNPAYLEGAAGFLMDPANLGGLFILALPASLIVVWLRRFSGPVRLLNGFLILAFLIGYLLSTHIRGLFLILALVLATPFFLSQHARIRKQLWKRGLLTALVAVPVVWFATDALRVRILYFLNYPVDPLDGPSLAAAWSRFTTDPLFGQGLGSFAYQWESYRPEGVKGTVLYPVSSYLDLLSEMGIAGLLLIVLPVLLLLVRGYRVWNTVPYLTVNKDVAERMDRFPKGHPGRARLERTQGRAPSPKIVLGSLLLGLTGFLIYVGWDYSLRLPFQLLLLSILFAVLAVFSRRHKKSDVSRTIALFSGVIPLALATWAIGFGVPRFYAQYLVYTTDEQLEYLLNDPDRIFIDSGSLTPIMRSYEAATDLNPGHAGAWLGIGRTWLAKIYADLWDSEELADAAAPALERAQALGPDFWLTHYELARVRAIQEDLDGMYIHLERAADLAPERTETLALLGSALLLDDANSAVGRSMVKQSLEITPDYEPSQNAMRRLDLNSRQQSVERETLESFDVLSPRLLAEQFEVINNPRERILAAGIMTPPEETLPTPDE